MKKLLFLLLLPGFAHAQSGSAAGIISSNPLTVDATPILTGAKKSVVVQACISITGAVPPYTITINSGSLPGGTSLTLTGNSGVAGCLTGTPNASGSFPLTLTIADSGVGVLQQLVAISPTISVASLSSIAVVPPAAPLAIGGTLQLDPFCTWSDGSVNDGLVSNGCPVSCSSSDATKASVVAATCVVTGVANDGGTHPVITATLNSVNGTSTITVPGTTTNPVITTTSFPTLPGGTANCQVNVQCPQTGFFLSATGGTPPYSNWTVSSGSLPTGLSLNASSGLVSGTPTGTTQTFSVTVQDSLSNTSAAQSLTLTIATVSSVSVTPATPVINVNGQQQLAALANFSDSSTLGITQGNNIALVLKDASATNTSGTTATTITSNALNIPAGDLIAVECRQGTDTTHTCTVTDSAGNTFTKIVGGQPTSSAGLGWAQMSYAKNSIASASDVFTCTYTAAVAYRVCIVAVYSGIDTSAPLDQSEGANDGGVFANGCTAGAVTTTVANEVVFRTCTNGSQNRTFSTSNGYTLEVTNAGGTDAMADLILSSTQTLATQTMTFSGNSDHWLSMTGTFKAAAASGCAWSSGTPAHASVNNAGLVQGLSADAGVTITCSYGGKSGTSTVTVNAPTLTSIAVTPPNPSITVGGTPQQFTATGTYSDSSTQNITASANWSSSNTAVATINTSGSATAVAAGTTTITAAQGAVSGTTILTVNSQSTGFTTLFRSNFESNPTSNPCHIVVGSSGNKGAGDVGQWYALNGPDLTGGDSVSDTRTTNSVIQQTGVAEEGFCGMVNSPSPRGANYPGNATDIEASLNGNRQEVWIRVWIQFSPTWVNCSTVTNCGHGAQHMFRFWNANGGLGNPEGWEVGLGVPGGINGDTMENIVKCGGGLWCSTGGQTLDNPGSDNFSISGHRGQWHCYVWHFKMNTQNHFDGLLDEYIDPTSSSTPSYHVAGWNITGTQVPPGEPNVNFGSNLGGGGSTGYPVNNNYFTIDRAAVTINDSLRSDICTNP